MKSKVIFGLASMAVVASAAFSSCTEKAVPEPTLKEMFQDKFLMGVAINENQASGLDSLGAATTAKHFNAIVPENVMKSAEIHPEEGRYNWEAADQFVKFGEDNNMFIVGHCLIWHSQLAPWFCVNDKGELVDSATLKQRMRDHIHTVVGRYKGRVKGWDVVNEAIVEDGSFRKTPFYEILGEEFIPLAFQYAHEADPDAELYYNDYGMNVEGRRNTVVRVVNEMKNRGLRVDGIGMQAHMGLDYPDLNEFEESLMAFAGTGCNVMITEWDMSALPTLTQSANVGDTIAAKANINPYADGLPADVAAQWNDRMEDVMRLLLKHSDVISRVNAWGVADGDSWKNDWPIPGRVDYPLLFDRNYQVKPFLAASLEPEVENVEEAPAESAE